MYSKDNDKSPSANERFHASGGVCPQTVLCGIWKFIARLNLCGTPACVKPPPRCATPAGDSAFLKKSKTKEKYLQKFDYLCGLKNS